VNHAMGVQGNVVLLGNQHDSIALLVSPTR
jgi:hypothetical protein